MRWLRREAEHFLTAVGYFSRLPVPARIGESAAGLPAAAPYLPAVGLVIGAIGGLVFTVALLLWSQPVAVLLALAAMLLATGAFHEDGLSDTADGLGGGWEKARILAIMKDSRVGSYGVVALWLALTARWWLLSSLPPAWVVPALLAAHAWSRLAALVLMATLDYARDDAGSKARPVAQRLPGRSLAFAALFALPTLCLLPWAQGLTALLLLALATVWFHGKCRRWLGGQTGDTLGAMQQLGEVACYLGLAANWVS